MTIPRPLRLLLWPASKIYGALAATRAQLYASGTLKQKQLKAAVISVGNLSVGGTGKTPFVIWLAEKLLAQGKRVAILTRGYRGAAGTSDEVELMRSRLQNRVLFGVGPDRYAQGHALESQHPIDIFLLDDGFQHLQLAREVDIVLIDSSRTMAEERLLPAGTLREGISAVSRADIVILTRAQTSQKVRQSVFQSWKLPIFSASTALRGFRRLGPASDSSSSEHLPPGSSFAFCGIGNPHAFLADLRLWDISIVGHQFFRDHRRFSANDLRKIESQAASQGATALITTEKDSWNLTSAGPTSLPVYVAIIDLRIDGETAFFQTIERLLQARGALA
jgi:tetraacyldisaccharide 4'-kinase